MNKKILTLMLTAATLLFGVTALVNTTKPALADNPDDIVGVWEVDAAAPYRPHLFSFHADGTMTSTNPTNVQENALQPHGGTNDSLGMGVWKEVDHGQDRYIVGTFEELNAFADNHQPTDKLSVSFKVKVGGDGNSFDGPASATVGADTFPSHLSGIRVTENDAAIDALSF